MNALAEFFTHDAGQRRRAWLDAQSARAANALNYYLGPAAQPVNALASALEFTDAGDVTAAADASRNLWNNPSLSSAIDYTTAGVALALPLYSQRLGAGIMDVADDLVRGYDPNRLNAITAYHGSPHDFDRFSMDKIGTGEGAQAYGHGLYFAESEDVARAYRDTLTNFNPTHVERVLIERGVSPDAASTYARWASDTGGRKLSFDKFAEMVNEPGPAPAIEAFRARIREDLPKIREATESTQGRMYEVNINANPDDFLDWDAPLSEQPPNLQEMARNADLSGLSGRMRNKFLHWRGDYQPPEINGVQLVVDEPTGNDLHSILTDYGTDSVRNAEMTRGLAEKGIPGIKYRDAGSRGLDGQSGTRNFVVFDENLIEIVRKYGIAGAALALGVSAGDVQAAMDREQ